jgi:hypothetical protein
MIAGGTGGPKVQVGDPMQVLPDAVIINLSPSQREMVRNPKHGEYMRGMALKPDLSRPRILIADIADLVARLRELQTVISEDPEYSGRRPREVLDQIILKIEDAAASQRRTYPPGLKSTDTSQRAVALIADEIIGCSFDLDDKQGAFDRAREIIVALDAAGIALVAKDPPNSN